MDYVKISSLKTPEQFSGHTRSLGIDLPLDREIKAAPQSPLAKPYNYKNRSIGNRWCILPMEGWDCLSHGGPSTLTERRWIRFGESGAKLLFGCEAAAVMKSGKSNTRQMHICDESAEDIAKLRQKMVDAHRARFGNCDDLYTGLQITHSGRFSHPNDDNVLESKTAYAHPLLDQKFGNDADNVVSDAEVGEIIENFINAAKLAKLSGFDFVDVKHAHGYLGHEFLSAFDRRGRYGGSFENRTRFFREIVEGIKAKVPGLDISVRLSLFDFFPYMKGAGDIGVPMGSGAYKYAFGGDGTGLGYDLSETIEFIRLARSLGIRMICTTVGSPYYNPHIQRPAYYPVSDGYLPPEDPLVGVARQINCVAELKKHFPDMALIGSGYTYLQEYLPHVAQYAVEHNMVDFVGIGRMVLSYPGICADTLQGKALDRRHICRTFGDCTTAPRHGLVSGCYPLDEFYKKMTEAVKMQEIKRRLRQK